MPVVTAGSNLEALLSELSGQIMSGNTPQDQDFIETKEQFLEDNYPHLGEGMHTHPDIFIAKQGTHGFAEPGQETTEDKGNLSEKEVYDFLKEQFKNDDCFLFHSYKSGIDHRW